MSKDVSFYEHIFSFQTLHTEKIDGLVLPSGNASHLDECTHVSAPATVQDVESPCVEVLQEKQPAAPPQQRRSTRTRTTNAYLSDYTCQNVTAGKKSPHAISKVLSYANL